MLNEIITKELYQTQKTLLDSERSSALALLPLLDYYSKAKLESLESLKMNGALLHRAPQPIFIV